jgi:superfamily I DNA/RNA helicase
MTGRNIDEETKQYILSARRRGDNVKKPRITVSTIHSMKGAECDNVILVPELNWTSYKGYQADPDPEHRVWYVGATRAKQTLHILNSVGVGVGDGYRKTYRYDI